MIPTITELAPFETATNDFLAQHRLMVAIFNRDCTFEEGNKKIKYPARSIATLPWRAIGKETINRLQKKGTITLAPIDEVFHRYNDGQHAAPIFTHLGGGIGDILVFSALTAYLAPRRIVIFTEERFKHLFNWFQHAVIFRPWHSTIVEKYTPASRITNYKHLKRIAMEWSAIQSHDTNWYDGFFQRIGIPKAPQEYDRPHLKTQRPTDLPKLIEKNSVLICHRASCQMRSSHFVDFHVAVRDAIPDKTVYVHETDLNEADKQYIQSAKKLKNRIIILPRSSVEQFLINLYDAEMVVTTDSSAIHFREGIKKPCLGVFGAMTVKSRTSTYKHTRSFNTESPCPYQPCFIHELQKGQICPNANEGDRVAKCQTGHEYQMQLFDQLIKIKP